jgi:hypothetical protein
MPVSTAIILLKTASAILMIGFGLVFALAAYPPLAGFVTLFTDVLFWPMDGTQSMAAPETRIMLAIGGGITLGWGVLVWQIASHLMPKQPVLAKSILLRSLLSWFVVDCLCSWLAGAPLNIAVNSVFLASFVLPLLRMNPEGGAER